MKAIAYKKYGSADVLELSEVRKPEIEGDRVLVRILAASANPYDWHFMRGVPYIARPAAMGVRRPNHTLLGSEVAGEVEAVGNAVTRFRPGDEVFGFVGEGGFAEYVSAPERLIALKPTNLSFEQAATVPLAAVTALQGLRDAGEIRSGEKVLIVGASEGSGRSPCRSRSGMARRSPESAAPGTWKWSARSAPTRSSTIRSRTSRGPANGTT